MRARLAGRTAVVTGAEQAIFSSVGKVNILVNNAGNRPHRAAYSASKPRSSR